MKITPVRFIGYNLAAFAVGFWFVLLLGAIALPSAKGAETTQTIKAVP